jgi:hypothetical protein
MRHPSKSLFVERAALRDIVRKHLPAWFRACAASEDIIVMHEGSFGTSPGEIFLLGCALKYAGSAGKTVHVTSGQKPVASRSKVKPMSIQAIYREEQTSPPRAAAASPRGRRHRSS